MSESRRGRKMSMEARMRLSLLRKGKPKTESWKENIRQANLGKLRSEETRRNISIAQRKRFAQTPKTVSESTKAKMSIAQKERFRLYGPVRWTETRKQEMSERMKRIWANRQQSIETQS